MKKLMLIIMVLVIACTSLNVFAAEETVVSINAYNDETNIEITELCSGIVRFEASASNLTTAASLIVVVYKNDEIVDFAVTEAPKETAKLSVQVEIPSELSDCTAVAMVWDGIDTMNALCDAFVLN